MRTYSNYLGLDVTAMVERFKEEISGRHDEHALAVAPIPDEETRHLPQGWRIVAGVVVLLLGYGAWHLFSTGSTQVAVPPPPSLNPPKTAAAKPAPTPAPAPTQHSIHRACDAGAFHQIRWRHGLAVRQHVVSDGARFDPGQAADHR